MSATTHLSAIVNQPLWLASSPLLLDVPLTLSYGNSLGGPTPPTDHSNSEDSSFISIDDITVGATS